MGRLNKQGLDYFTHDVDLSTDEKIQLIESDHGLIGYAVYIKLLERIYRNGYYLEMDKRKLKIFSKNNNVKTDECINILDTCIKEKLFDKKLYKNYNILTSKSIQVRFCEAITRRKKIDFNKNYLLIKIDDYKNLINVDINIINDNKSTQHNITEHNITEIKLTIVEYLNKKANKKYKPNGTKTTELIERRLKEGFTVDDFKKVIDNKFIGWGKDPYWNKFLRPETLFGTKFEGYLNENPDIEEEGKDYGIKNGQPQYDIDGMEVLDE